VFADDVAVKIGAVLVVAGVLLGALAAPALYAVAAVGLLLLLLAEVL
jgi:hypothetical protein